MLAMAIAVAACSSNKASTTTTAASSASTTTSSTVAPTTSTTAGQTITITPDTGLTNNESVQITGTGYQPSEELGVTECANKGDQTGAGDCNLGAITIIHADALGQCIHLLQGGSRAVRSEPHRLHAVALLPPLGGPGGRSEPCSGRDRAAPLQLIHFGRSTSCGRPRGVAPAGAHRLARSRYSSRSPDPRDRIWLCRAGAITPRIFLSYRREESAGYAGRLHDALAGRFGRRERLHRRRLDRTRSELRGGPRKYARLLRHAPRHDGTSWAGATDASGRRRLDDPADYVRREIEQALAQARRLG